MKNGQLFWIGQLMRILANLILYFFEFCAIFYEFWKLELISEAFKGIKDVEN
jgi:hypothetical protein